MNSFNSLLSSKLRSSEIKEKDQINPKKLTEKEYVWYKVKQFVDSYSGDILEDLAGKMDTSPKDIKKTNLPKSVVFEYYWPKHRVVVGEKTYSCSIIIQISETKEDNSIKFARIVAFRNSPPETYVRYLIDKGERLQKNIYKVGENKGKTSDTMSQKEIEGVFV